MSKYTKSEPNYCNKHGAYANDICPGCLKAAAPDLLEACKAFLAGWNHFCNCIDFGRSNLDADAICFMNEVPGKIEQAKLKAGK